MAKANVNVDIDADVKELATRLLSSMGLDQTTAIDMFFRQIIAEKKLPFQPVAQESVEDRILSAIDEKNIPIMKLESDGNGNIIIDKDSDPEDYDWGMNG
jgi:DNA-damage-inducible protein J